MTYQGHVKNGQILLDESIRLPEGAKVSVVIVDQHTVAASSLWKRLRDLAGTVEGPEDWARNHDHYIHGTPPPL